MVVDETKRQYSILTELQGVTISTPINVVKMILIIKIGRGLKFSFQVLSKRLPVAGGRGATIW